MKEENQPERKTNAQSSANKKRYRKPYRRKAPRQQYKRKFWNADKIVSFSAMAIALFTLVVLIYQSRILDKQYELTVKQQKASVLPYVQMINFTGEDAVSISIQNKGLGPAFLQGLYLKRNDSLFQLYCLYNYYLDMNDDQPYSFNASSIIPGLVLAPGEELELFSARGGSGGLGKIQDFFNDRFYNQSDESFIIEYQSVFEDTWWVNSSFEIVKKDPSEQREVYDDLIR